MMFSTKNQSKKRTHAVIGMLAALSATTILMAGCGSGSTASSNTPPADSNQPVTISFMEVMSSGALKDTMTKLTKDFMAKNPTITVELQDQPDYGTLQTKINAQTAAGTPPTIAQAYENWADEFAQSQVIVPLDDYVSQSKDYPNFFDGIKKDLKLTDGKTWMWPFNKSVVVQYYNTTMVPQAPKTWDEFASAAKKASNSKVVGLSIDPGNSSGPAGDTALFEILAEANGSRVFADDGAAQFTADGAVKALDYLKQMKQNGSLALGTNYPGQTALGGQSGAFDVSSVASYQFNKKAVGGKFPMGVAALPAGPAATANQLAGTNIVLFSKASDAQKAAAWKYMQFLTSAEEMATWSVGTGYLPVNKDALEQPVFKEYAAKNPWVVDATKQLDSATALPAKSWVSKASAALAQAIQDAVNNGMDSKEALQKAQDAAVKAQKDAS